MRRSLLGLFVSVSTVMTLAAPAAAAPDPVSIQTSPSGTLSGDGLTATVEIRVRCSPEGDEKRHAMVGNRTGETFRLGDRLSVKLVEAAPVAGALRFAIMSHGRAEARGRVSKGSPGRAQRSSAADEASARREAPAVRKAKKHPRRRVEKKAKARR